MNKNILKALCVTNAVVIGSMLSVGAVAASETVTTTVTKSIVKSSKASVVDKAKSAAPKKVKADDTLKLISRTDNQYGLIHSYIDITSIRPSNIVVTDDKGGDYRKAVIVTVYHNGLTFNNGTEVYSTVEQAYVSCANNAFYQHKFLTADINGQTTYEWVSDKTGLLKSDFLLSQKDSIYDKSASEICAIDITGMASK